jgi:PhnB protein
MIPISGRNENMANVKPLPDGYHSVTPYLFLRDAGKAIEFYKNVFSASEKMRMSGPSGRVMHAEIKIGDSTVMLADENPDMGVQGPQSIGGTATSVHVDIENVDGVVQKAVEAGAKLVRPVKDQFYSDRSGTLIDPFGHMWSVATHIEDVSPEEMRKRMATINQSTGA